MAEHDEGMSTIDRVLETVLASTYAQVTRRSFLSSMTRQLLGWVGVGVAAQIFPYFASEAEAAVGNQCGLHGISCTPGTNCAKNLPNTSAQNAWVQCCRVEKCNPEYRCCTYIDWCGLRPAGWPSGCPSAVNNTGGTRSWCIIGEYVCTEVSCPTTYPSLSNCSSHCSGESCAQ